MLKINLKDIIVIFAQKPPALDNYNDVLHYLSQIQMKRGWPLRDNRVSRCTWLTAAAFIESSDDFEGGL